MPQRQQLLLPLAADPAGQPVDARVWCRRAATASRSGASGRGRRPARRLDRQDRVGRATSSPRRRRVVRRRAAGVGSRSGSSAVDGPGAAGLAELLEVLAGQLQPPHGPVRRHVLEEGDHLADLVERGRRRRRTGLAAVAGRQAGHPLVGLVGQLDAADARASEPLGGPRRAGQADRRGCAVVVGRLSRAATCAWSRESWNRWPRAAPGRRPASAAPARGGPAARAGRLHPLAPRAADRVVELVGMPAVGPAQQRRGAARARRRARRLGAGGGSPSSRATTALSHSRSPQSPRSPWPGAAARARGRSARSARRPGLAQPLPGPRGDLRCRACRAGGRPGRRRVRRCSSARRPTTARAGRLGRRSGAGRRAGGGPSSRPPRLEPGHRESRPLRRRRAAVAGRPVAEPACLVAPVAAVAVASSKDHFPVGRRPSRLALTPGPESRAHAHEFRCPSGDRLPAHRGRCSRKNRSQLPWKMASMSLGG